MKRETVKPHSKLKIHFRRATLKDFDGFFGVFVKSIKNYFPEYSERVTNFLVQKSYNPRILKDLLKKRLLIIYLAIFQKKTVGYLMVRPLGGGVALAEWLAVDKKYQGKGVATGLLRAWEEDAKEHGFHKLHLWTDQRVVGFYKGRGWKLVGKIPRNFYGADDYLFYKAIQIPKEENFLR